MQHTGMQSTNEAIGVQPRGAGKARRAAVSGFTLIELLVTFAVVAVMLTLAVPSFVAFQRNSQLTAAANSFLASVSAARAEAMKRQLNAFVRPVSGNDWRQGWRVYIDSNWNNVYVQGTDVLVSEQPPLTGAAGMTIPNNIATSDGTGVYVEISGAGFVISDTSGALVASQFLDLANTTDTRRIIIDGSGRIRVCIPPGAPKGDASCVASTF